MASSASTPIVKVLFALYPGMDSMDFVGPLEVLADAQHESSNPETKAFKCAFAGPAEHVVSAQGISFRTHMSYEDAHTSLAEFDILVVPGGASAALDPIMKTKSEPLGLIQSFSDLQKKNPAKELTLMSICTGSLLLGFQGILSGLSATTHPDYLAKFENICSTASQRDLAERCDIVDERYVVNNLRFDLGNEEENPYIRRKSDGRRPSMGRKGSISWKESNTRRESNARRSALKLSGLRVITAGGVTCGLDASLYLVSIMVSEEAASEAARNLQHTWTKGIVVDGVDI